LTGKSGGVADGMKSADEAVAQYSSAMAQKTSGAIESALGKLSPEEMAAYNSLSPAQKAKIQDQVYNSMNNGKGDNALSLIKSTVGPAVAASKAQQEAQSQKKSSGEVLPFLGSIDNTMFSNFYMKTTDGNYQKGDKLYKASGDMLNGVTVTEIGNAPVKQLTQKQQDISKNLDACHRTANSVVSKADEVIKYSTATGMLNGMMHMEYSAICDKKTTLVLEMAKLGGYDSPNISSQINKVNGLAKELDALCNAYKAKDAGMSESYYNVTNTIYYKPSDDLSFSTSDFNSPNPTFSKY